MPSTPEEREGSQDTLSRTRRRWDWPKAEALGWDLVGLIPGASLCRQKTICVMSELQAVVLEVPIAQAPSLRLLEDSNRYSQGLQLLPSLREDLAFLVLPEKQRRPAQRRPG